MLVEAELEMAVSNSTPSAASASKLGVVGRW
jgi:hypothetical protein